MKPIQWLSILTGGVVLITLAPWTSRGANAGREAGAAIVQAQRNIADVQAGHVEVDPAALRAAEADLLTATTAFNRADYTTRLPVNSHSAPVVEHKRC